MGGGREKALSSYVLLLRNYPVSFPPLALGRNSLSLINVFLGQMTRARYESMAGKRHLFMHAVLN